MRTRLSSAILILCVIGGALTAQTKPNFSGVWTMDAAKSDFGGTPAPAAMTRTITHKDPVLKIDTVQSGGATGDRTINTTFSTDGKAQTNTVNGSPMTTTGKWEGTTLVLSSTMTMGEASIPIEDRFVQSADGKTLTVTRKVTTPDGLVTLKIVMTKKE